MSKHDETFEALLGTPTTSPDRTEIRSTLGPEPESEDPPDPEDLADDLEGAGPDDGEPTLRDAVEQWAVAAPKGVVALPTYVCDLVLRNLGLAEQAVLVRLLRVAGGFGVPSPRVRPSEIGRACGVRTPLAVASIRSLAEKGLVTVRKRNPITGSARFTLRLPDLVAGTFRVCAVCHRTVDPEGDGWLPAPLSLKPDGSFQYVMVHAECLEGATL